MIRGKVFVVQQPAYFDRNLKSWVPKYDISAAEKYGDLVYLLGHGNIYKDRLENAIESLSSALSSYGPDDYILAVGDPVAIAAATMIAGNRSVGSINLLKYDRITREYEAYNIDVDPRRI